MEKEKSIGFPKSRHNKKWGGKDSWGFEVVTMGHKELNQAHLYILNNTKVVVLYIIAHKIFEG